MIHKPTDADTIHAEPITDEMIREAVDLLKRNNGPKITHLAFNKEEWVLARNIGYDFTDEELEAGLKHPRLYIGSRYGVECYIAKNVFHS